MLCILFVAMLLFFPEANAALQVTAFSCNDQSGAVNVDNLASMSCQATVNNPDQGTATLNSVVLYPDGNWLESSSYAGSGFDTSISAGASTVATFTGLTPNVAGANAFDNINMDGAIDTYVGDTSVNVMDIKSLSLSSSISSGDQNNEFDLQATVTAGGSLDATNLAIALTSCSLKSGESSSVDVGALTNNAQGSQTWKILIGSNHCDYTVTATGTSGSVTTSDSATGRVTNNNPVSDSGGNAGGGAGAGGGGSPSAAAGEAKPGEAEKFDVDFSQPGVAEFVTKALEGQRLRFSFDGGTEHTLTLDKVLADSVIMTVQSEPVTFTLRVGETRNVDFNKDGQDDLSVTLVSIFGKTATVQMKKLEGAVVLAAEEKKAAAGVLPGSLLPQGAGEEGDEREWLNYLWWGLLLIALIFGIEFYLKRKHGAARD